MIINSGRFLPDGEINNVHLAHRATMIPWSLSLGQRMLDASIKGASAERRTQCDYGRDSNEASLTSSQFVGAVNGDRRCIQVAIFSAHQSWITMPGEMRFDLSGGGTAHRTLNSEPLPAVRGRDAYVALQASILPATLPALNEQTEIFDSTMSSTFTRYLRLLGDRR
jgi:hypothetical protein